MAAISPNLLAPEPTIDAVSQALQTAAGRIDSYEQRAAGSAVAWTRDWDEAFHDALLDRVIGWLRD